MVRLYYWVMWTSIALALAHVAGSYGVELIDMLNNYGMTVPVTERLAAPVRAVPWLLSETTQANRGRGGLPFELKLYWLGYLVPFVAMLLATPVVRLAVRQLRRDDRRGFTLTIGGVDSDVGSDRPPT